MSLMQKMKGNDKTFTQLTESAQAKVLHEGAKSQCIDVVFDVYKETSIKDAERANRGVDRSIQFKNIAPGHNIQQWRKLLCSSANKASLIKFLVDEWKGPRHREKFENKTLYVTCEEVCNKITKDQWEAVTELKSSQEEADNRMVLHALHAEESGYKAVVITAEDADVMMLCLGFSSSVYDALVGMHTFTECDTVSAFAGRRKMATLKLLKSNKAYQEAFSELGCSWVVSGELFEKLQDITYRVYVPCTSTTYVNTFRHQLFCARRGEVESSQLSPCVDYLFMHAIHAIRLPYGGGLCRLIPLCQIPMTVDGPNTMTESWSYSGCVAHQHLIPCCSCSPASV